MSAWPNQDMCQANAQGQLTKEQKEAFGTPPTAGAFLGVALVSTLSVPAVALLLAGISLLALFVVLGTARTVETGSLGAWLEVAQSLGEVIAQGIAAAPMGAFLVVDGAIALALVGLVAMIELRLAYRRRIVATSAIRSAEGEVRRDGAEYVGYAQGKAFRPLLRHPQLIPGRYRLYVYERLRVLLSAEPL